MFCMKVGSSDLKSCPQKWRKFPGKRIEFKSNNSKMTLDAREQNICLMLCKRMDSCSGFEFSLNIYKCYLSICGRILLKDDPGSEVYVKGVHILKNKIFRKDNVMEGKFRISKRQNRTFLVYHIFLKLESYRQILVNY